LAGSLCTAVVASELAPGSADRPRSGPAASGRPFLLAPPSLLALRQVVPAAAGGDLLTYDYDNGRSGDDPAGSRIATLSARPVWNDDLDGAVYGEPLIDGGTIYVATENDIVDAVAAATGKVLWSVRVGTPVSLSVIDSAPTLSSGCGDINPLGVTGTPVIDPARDQLFLAEETMLPGREGWSNVQHWLVAVSLSGHRELWHREIDPPRPNNADSYYIAAEQQRSALTLFDGRLYVPFGGLYGDCGQYHGYVEELAESGLGAVGTYQVPTQREGGIWGTSGIVVSAAGDLYFATGNGSSDSVAHFDEGNSVVELSTSLVRLGVWAPSDWVQLNDQDWDLGSAGPVQVPGTSLIFAAGKPAQQGSFGSLMSEGHLGGIGHGAYTASLCPGGGVFGADATDIVGTGKSARIFIYAACGSGTEAAEVTTSPVSFRAEWRPSTGSPDGPPIVAGGMVWALDWNRGELYGMGPATGHVAVMRATGPVDHFATPAVGDNMVLVPTQSGVEAFRALG
jgi:polyvinyl alcohol dehydrogenase (cytochrome)